MSQLKFLVPWLVLLICFIVMGVAGAGLLDMVSSCLNDPYCSII